MIVHARLKAARFSSMKCCHLNSDWQQTHDHAEHALLLRVVHQVRDDRARALELLPRLPAASLGPLRLVLAHEDAEQGGQAQLVGETALAGARRLGRGVHEHLQRITQQVLSSCLVTACGLV